MAIADFLSLMNNTITWSPLSSRDNYGVPTYGTATSYRARVVYKKQLRRQSNGAIIEVEGHVWVAGTPNIGTEDKVTLPDGSSPPIKDVERITDEDGSIHHVKVWFGSPLQSLQTT